MANALGRGTTASTQTQFEKAVAKTPNDITCRTEMCVVVIANNIAVCDKKTTCMRFFCFGLISILHYIIWALKQLICFSLQKTCSNACPTARS